MSLLAAFAGGFTIVFAYGHGEGFDQPINWENSLFVWSFSAKNDLEIFWKNWNKCLLLSLRIALTRPWLHIGTFWINWIDLNNIVWRAFFNCPYYAHTVYEYNLDQRAIHNLNQHFGLRLCRNWVHFHDKSKTPQVTLNKLCWETDRYLLQFFKMY